MAKLTIFLLIIFMALQSGNTYSDNICILPIGKIEDRILEYLKTELRQVLGKDIYIAKPRPIPESAYNPKRSQYHSTLILNEIRSWDISGYERVLGIVDMDLYVPQLNFVFGEADLTGKVALISLVRLKQQYYGLPEDDKLFKLRALKEAVHELGHTYGLPHCPDAGCVMHFSNSLLDTDKKDFRFCPRCQKRLKD